MNDPQSQTLTQLVEKFRTLKHDVNNSLGVILALTEMTERKPEFFEKLFKAIMTRTPTMVEDLRIFGEELNTFVQGSTPNKTDENSLE